MKVSKYWRIGLWKSNLLLRKSNSEICDENNKYNADEFMNFDKELSAHEISEANTVHEVIR